VARWLAERGARNIALAGRHSPGPEAEAVIRGLEAAGVRVLVGTLNVGSPGSLSAFLEDIRSTLGPLRGVVHAAGSLQDAALVHQTWEGFETVLQAKVGGAWNLHLLTERDPLRFFVLFSSIAGPLGAPGQANHAAGSEFLDALAVHRRRRGLPALALDWGPWEGGGAAAREDLAEHRRTAGISDIPVRSALDLLELGIARDASRLVVAPLDWSQFVERRPACRPLVQHLLDRQPAPKPAVSAAAPDDWLAAWRGAPAARRGPLLEEHLQKLAGRVLGLDASTRIPRDQPLNALGLDSLMAVELRNAISKAVGLPLVATLLFSYPTIGALVAYLLDLAFETTTAATTSHAEEGSHTAVMDALEKLEQLSDAEVEEWYERNAGGAA
jgi:polyketide synthase 12/myxalamid-type polyketide synthase MxaB